MKKSRYEWGFDRGKAWDFDSSVNVCPYQKLWMAVLNQAFRDLRQSVKIYNKKYQWVKSKNDFYNNQAYNWFMGNTEKFKTVCEFAGFNPEYIREQAMKIIGIR